MQAVNHERHILVRKTGQAILKIVHEAFDLLLLYIRFVVVVGLIVFHQRVFLFLYGLIGLIDRKIKLGDERPVHPGFAHIVAETLSLLSRHHPHNDGHGDDDQERACDGVAPKMALIIIKFIHKIAY